MWPILWFRSTIFKQVLLHSLCMMFGDILKNLINRIEGEHFPLSEYVKIEKVTRCLLCTDDISSIFHN